VLGLQRPPAGVSSRDRSEDPPSSRRAANGPSRTTGARRCAWRCPLRKPTGWSRGSAS